MTELVKKNGLWISSGVRYSRGFIQSDGTVLYPDCAGGCMNLCVF